MSTTINQIKNERDTEVELAVTTRDSEALYQLASLFKEEGEDEIAEELRDTARRFDKEDISYDEWVDNELSN